MIGVGESTGAACGQQAAENIVLLDDGADGRPRESRLMPADGVGHVHAREQRGLTGRALR